MQPSALGSHAFLSVDAHNILKQSPGPIFADFQPGDPGKNWKMDTWNKKNTENHKQIQITQKICSGIGKIMKAPKLHSPDSTLVSTRLDSSRLVSSRLVSTRLDSTRLVSTRLDSTPRGSARLDSNRFGLAPLDSARQDSTHLGRNKRDQTRLD